MSMAVRLSKVASALTIHPRSVYQARRRGRANYLFKKTSNGRPVGQWWLDVDAYQAHLASTGRQIPIHTKAAIEAALNEEGQG